MPGASPACALQGRAALGPLQAGSVRLSWGRCCPIAQLGRASWRRLVQAQAVLGVMRQLGGAQGLRVGAACLGGQEGLLVRGRPWAGLPLLLLPLPFRHRPRAGQARWHRALNGLLLYGKASSARQVYEASRCRAGWSRRRCGQARWTDAGVGTGNGGPLPGGGCVWHRHTQPSMPP